MVSMEAIRQLSGSRPSKAADLTCRSAARTFQHLAIPQKDKKHQEASQHSAVVQLKAEGSVSPSSPTAKASQRSLPKAPMPPVPPPPPNVPLLIHP